MHQFRHKGYVCSNYSILKVKTTLLKNYKTYSDELDIKPEGRIDEDRVGVQGQEQAHEPAGWDLEPEHSAEFYPPIY